MPALFEISAIEKNPTAYSFSVGTGFKMLGSPKVPSPPVGGASACEPTAPADEGSWHRLIPPDQVPGHYIRARWNPTGKWWAPPLESGARRIAFTSEYLAACGWVYGEAE